MIWLPVHTDLPRHIKLMRFSRLLKISQPTAVGHVVMLWLWALEVAPTGDLEPFSVDEIAAGAGWRRRDREMFVEALKAAGFLDDDDRIHDWEDYAGDLISRREKDRLRKRNQRLLDRMMQQNLVTMIEEKKTILSDGRPT